MKTITCSSTSGSNTSWSAVTICQVFKSTADVDGGRALYEGYSAVSDSGAHNFLRLRETVLLRKEDRKMFVQANSRVNGTQQQQQQVALVIKTINITV